jgi:hypothetical protein
MHVLIHPEQLNVHFISGWNSFRIPVLLLGLYEGSVQQIQSSSAAEDFIKFFIDI